VSAGQGRGRLDDAEFRRLVDEAKERHNISDVVRRRTKVVRADRELVALCLFHKERTPSMRLNDAKGIYHCFGCGASGYIVKLVRETEGLGFLEAMRWLGAAGLPAVDPAARMQAAEEDARDRQRAIDRARYVWASAVPAAGTPAEVYARSRGIVMPLLDMIVGDPIGYTVAAKRYGVHNRKAKRFLLDAINAWPDCVSRAYRVHSEADIQAAADAAL
jgi:hypothetical protein